MSEPNPPAPDHVPDNVLPDHVLEELLDAFSEESALTYNFDDPSIDRLLGITDEHELDDDDLDDDDFDDDDDDLNNDDFDDDDLDLDDDDEEATGDPAAEAPPVAVGPAGDPPEAAVSARRTIVIAEDDRPDTVYLDEEKERAFHKRRDAVDESGERATIVIADLDEHGSGGEPPLARSRGGIDPRIRARRISVRRAEGRRRLIWTGIGIVVLLVAVGVIAVFASSIFDVRDVTVQGAVYTDQDVLDSVTV